MTQEFPVLALQKSARLMLALLDNQGRAEPEVLAASLGLPESTLFRHLNALIKSGLLVRTRRGYYSPSPALLKRTEKFDLKNVLAEASRAILQDVSRELNMTTHLGVLENDMVTYVVKVASPDMQVFTQEGGQLEAYCSGIGKILLAALPQTEVNKYLLSGPFPKLTDHTITDPKLINRELNKVRRVEYAQDSGEIAEGLYCVAVPVRTYDGEIVAAISASSFNRSGKPPSAPRLEALRAAAAKISGKLGATNAG